MILSSAVVLAVAGTAAAATGGNNLQEQLLTYAPFVLLFVVAYFLFIRPQQKRQCEHMAQISAIKRGDTVVLSNGMIGKVVRVEDAELGVEIAQNVTVKVVKVMVTEVRTRGEPAANDAKG